jgi:hypothetical protein
MLAPGAAVPQPLQIAAGTARTGPRLVLIGGRTRWGAVALHTARVRPRCSLGWMIPRRPRTTAFARG